MLRSRPWKWFCHLHLKVRLKNLRVSPDDVTRQVRFYLVDRDSSETAFRFREAVRATAKAISLSPKQVLFIGSTTLGCVDCGHGPISGFEAMRFFYVIRDRSVEVVRILHAKRDVRKILGREHL